MNNSTIAHPTITDHTDPMFAQAERYNAGYVAYMNGQPLTDCTTEDMAAGWRSACKGEQAAAIADTAAYLGADADYAIASYADMEVV